MTWRKAISKFLRLSNTSIDTIQTAADKQKSQCVSLKLDCCNLYLYIKFVHRTRLVCHHNYSNALLNTGKLFLLVHSEDFKDGINNFIKQWNE